MKFPLLLSALAAILVLPACTTPEFRLTHNQCQGDALRQYPVVHQPQVVRRSRQVEVPDGSTVCESQTMKNKDAGSQMSATRSVCRPGTRPMTEYFDETVMVDMNEGARYAQTEHCVRERCLQRYGNQNCKPS